MRRVVFGHPFTKAAIEMALWDILGKSVGLPLYRLLGGAVREFVPTKWSISGVEPIRAAEIAAWAVEQGFHAIHIISLGRAHQDSGAFPERCVAAPVMSSQNGLLQAQIRIGSVGQKRFDQIETADVVNQLWSRAALHRSQRIHIHGRV